MATYPRGYSGSYTGGSTSGGGGDRYAQVNRAFQETLGRPARPDEVEQWAKDFIDTGRGPVAISDVLKTGTEFQNVQNQPYADYAHQLAGIEIQARQRELEMQKQQMAMMERLMPLEEEARKLEIAAARARQNYEGLLRTFTEPILQGQGLPGQYSNLGQPATSAEIENRFENISPHIDELLTSRGLSYSGDVERYYGDLAKDITMDDIARARSEQFNLVGLPFGMPFQQAPSANISSSYRSQPYTAINTGYGMTSDALNRAILSESELYNRNQVDAMNRNQPSTFGQLATGILGKLGGNLFGGIGTNLANRWFS